MKRVIRSDDEWRQLLSAEQYLVCRKHGTERAFSGRYYTHKGAGLYCCICCGMPLFSSATKYDSGSGWPSFWAPDSSARLKTRQDCSFGMSRTEVACGGCDAHLGHVFRDGPEPTGLRYCINSAALDFVPQHTPREEHPIS